MASVTQSVTNYLGGVSNQPDDKKLTGQVRQAINAYPDPTFGLTKRPGFKYLTELKDGVPTGGSAFDNTDLDNAKWFYYNRDADEKYVGCIVGKSTSTYGEIHIWNTTDNNKCAVTYGTNAREYLGKSSGTVTLSDGTNATEVAATNASDYDIITIRDSSIIVNKQKYVLQTAAPAYTANKQGTVRIHLVEYGAEYSIKIASTESSPVFTTFTSTINTRSGDEFTNAADTSSNTSSAEGKLDAKEILTSLRTLILAGGDGSPGAVSGFGSAQVKIIGTSLEIDYTGSGGFILSVEGGVGGESLTSYQDSVDGITELAGRSEHGRVVRIQNTSAATDTYFTRFVANDGESGEGVWEETIGPGVSTGLDTSTMPHQLFCSAKNTFSFSRLDGSVAANKKVLTERLVGDAVSNSNPTFVDNKIQQSFYYNNRLGFLTEDNVSMSQAGEFFNFYMVTAQTATDADPIDISCSSTRPAVLHGIIPTAGGLLLFSQNQQFVMFSSEGNLTPSTALIRGISNYRMDSKIDPVDTGTVVNFVSKTHETAGFTRVFGMLPQSNGQAPKVVDVGRVVAEYIPATITALTASPQNSFIAMYGTGTDKIYFYRTYSDGERDIMQSWFNWQCPGNTHFVEVDSDTMYTVIKTGTGSSARYNLCSATMTQTPEETIITTAEGQQVNPHMDFYIAASSVKSREVKTLTIAAGGSGYSSPPTLAIAAPPDGGVQATATCTVNAGAINAVTITNCGSGYAVAPTVTISGGGGSSGSITAAVDSYDGSRCYIPYSDVTTLTPVIVIAGAVTNFSGTTQSGFTINPDRATDGDGTYFKVPDKDLYSQAANIYVGYKYNYDITLPKIYYYKDPDKKLSDYTAALTIARCKFSVGQSSVVGFKLKRKGVQAATQSFTGDGSTTAFSPDFTVKDKADVIVKKNGAKQLLTTDYTIADHATNSDQITVTFVTAPAAASTAANVTTAADSVEIYVDEWYTLQPTQDANYYLGDDVPIETQNVFTVPIHQRSDNYTLRVFSDSPFPIALTSMAWEGQYSPRFYRRT